MRIQIIDRSLLDQTSAKAISNERLRMNYNIHTELIDPVNRMLNALEPGTVLPIHRHLHPYKNETFIILRGELDVLLYKDDGSLLDCVTLNASKGNYGIDIPGNVWHSLDVKESGTVVFEVKQGPYSPIAPEDIF
ncbi:MAG: WbuC family cupin fold metalloprotein [Candidatus Symbiothrix sp.]|jgi:cupin fold WbuC family metalloprotein|nr:WbuC family cupin fold metalloprotein [Candidatus Symbiothrix sp.]